MSDGAEIDQMIDVNARKSEKPFTRLFSEKFMLKIYQLNRSRLQLDELIFAVF